nr:type IV pilus modification protein PilV [Stenoxybacter acetivorans]
MPRFTVQTQLNQHRHTQLKNRQKGSTLIEVMISIFVLSFGVLVLMVAQLRGVSSVQEAGNQTVVAQAAQNLMESMLTNPVLIAPTNDATVAAKDYSFYENLWTGIKSNNNCNDNYTGGQTYDRNGMANIQLCHFKNEVNANLTNIEDINLDVKPDDTLEIKWKMQIADGEDKNLGTDANGMIEYTYSLPISD